MRSGAKRGAALRGEAARREALRCPCFIAELAYRTQVISVALPA
jgi:hypothetical protein